MKVSDRVAAISKEINTWVKTLDKDDRPRVQPAEIALLTHYTRQLVLYDTLMEIGTGWGGSVAIFNKVCESAGRSNGRIVTIDNGSNFSRFGPKDGTTYDDFISNRLTSIYGVRANRLGAGVFCVHADSTKLCWPARDINLLFIDGAHTYEGVRGDIKNMVPHIVSGGVVIFHDYHMEGVKKAMDEFLVEKGLMIENRGGATVAVRLP